MLKSVIEISTLKNAPPDAARAAMLSEITALSLEMIGLEVGLGRTLGEDAIATRDQPPFPASAMDGYAVIAANCPATLQLVGESAAGIGYAATLSAGQCVRIFTGAPMPEGADAVVIQEDTSVSGKFVTMPAITMHKNVRAQGNDFVIGTKLVSAGTRLDPIALALIAATGRDQIMVSRKPIVAILSGGDEIISPGTTASRFQVYDSITSGLTALVQNWGAQVINFAPHRDKIEALTAGFETALAQADLVVTIGGASVGDHDLMKPTLSTFAANFVVDKVAVRPGKPTWFATTPLGPVLGLPGNPASALVCAHLFLLPILSKLLNQREHRSVGMAKLTHPLPKNGPREHYLRAFTTLDGRGQVWVTPLEDQDSALLSVFQAANALIKCEADSLGLASGGIVSYVDLGRAVAPNNQYKPMQ